MILGFFPQKNYVLTAFLTNCICKLVGEPDQSFLREQMSSQERAQTGESLMMKPL